jgi:glycosyltransferase involved in cell wall biosynthesis
MKREITTEGRKVENSPMALVSVIMPMRNAEPYVRAALLSVLGQRDLPAGTEIEVVVVDDGSTDRSADVVRGLGDPRVRLLRGPCQGISAALNLAVSAARGEIIVRCDADDLFPEDRLARQLRWLEAHPDFGAVGGVFTTMTPTGQLIADLGGQTAQEITDELRAGQTRTSLCTYAIRAAVLRQVGGFRPYFATAEDLDFMLRLGEQTRVWFDPHSVYRYRLHPTSITHTQGLNLRDFYEATARAFAAQRRAGGADDLARGCPPPPPAAQAGAPVRARAHIQDLLIGRAWDSHAAGQKFAALWAGWSACWMQPLRWKAWQSLALLTLKRAGGALC